MESLKAFQLDNGIKDRVLIRKCRAEGECCIRPWPPEREGQKDPKWIPEILALDAPVVSKDFTLATEMANRQAMPAHISGIIVPRPTAKKVKPFKADHLMSILEAFKRAFPRWNAIDWTDLYVEIRDNDVSVTHIADCEDTIARRIAFNEPEFVFLMTEAISTARDRRSDLIPR